MASAAFAADSSEPYATFLPHVRSRPARSPAATCRACRSGVTRRSWGIAPDSSQSLRRVGGDIRDPVGVVAAEGEAILDVGQRAVDLPAGRPSSVQIGPEPTRTLVQGRHVDAAVVELRERAGQSD